MQSDKKKRYWLNRAAEGGYNRAQFDLSKDYYQTADFTDTDANQNAFQWALKATEQGHQKAQYLLGVYHLMGIGTSKNTSKAVEYLQPLSRKEDSDAQDRLAELYTLDNSVKSRGRYTSASYRSIRANYQRDFYGIHTPLEQLLLGSPQAIKPVTNTTNSLLKKLLVDNDFDDIYPFYEGLARVRKDKQYGYINREGEIVIPIDYLGATRFHNGRALVVKTNFWGNQKIALIDNTGKLLTGFDYDFAEFANHHAFELKGRKTRAGMQVILMSQYTGSLGYDAGQYPANELIQVAKNKKYGFIDTSGKEVIPLIYSSASHFNDRDFQDASHVFLNDKAGLINRQGEYIVEPIYDYISTFKDNIALVKLDGKAGFINLSQSKEAQFNPDDVYNVRFGLTASKPDGKKITITANEKKSLDEQYDRFSLLSENWINVEIDDKEGIIDRTGKILVPIEYKNITLKKDKFFLVEETRLGKRFEEDYYGLWDSSGKMLFPVNYRRIQIIETANNQHLFILTTNDNAGLVNADGEAILPFAPRLIREADKQHMLAFGSKHRLFDVSKTPPHEVAVFDFIDDLESDGKLFSVYQDNQGGVIDRTGQIVIPLSAQFAYISKFTEGLAIAMSPQGLHGVINLKGEVVIPLIYNHIEISKDGFFVVRQKLKTGVLDKQGKTIIPPKYDDIQLNKDYYITFNRMGNYKEYGVFSPNGSVIIPPSVNQLCISSMVEQPIFRVEDDKRWTLYDKEKHILRQGELH